MTSGRVAFYGTDGLFSDNSNLTFSTDTLTVTNLIASSAKVSDLTNNRIVIAGADGELSDNSNLTFVTDTLTATKIGAFEAAGAINFANQNMTNVDIDSGDIASNTVINKSPDVNFNSGDVQGSLTLDKLATGTGELIIQDTSVEGKMLSASVADTSTIELSSDTLSVIKVPYDLSPGTNLNLGGGGTFDGSAVKTINLDTNISVTSVTASSLTNTRIVIAGSNGELEDNSKLTFDGTELNIDGNISASGQIYAPNIIGGTSNIVFISSSNGQFKTDEINSKV